MRSSKKTDKSSIKTPPPPSSASAPPSRGVLFIVATPIGNLDDLTPRARKTLENVDAIAAEDTRTARKLLSYLGIGKKRLYAYHDHGEEAEAERLIGLVEAEGLSLAIITDAGTPCVSDPGYRIVRLARARGLTVHPIPGASALTTLVSASGLASHRFTFIGFLPTKAAALTAEIASWARPATEAQPSIVFFEATRRLAATVRAIAAVYPGARIAIGRELTKLFEEIATLTIEEALVWVDGHATMRGEATCMVELPPAAAVAADELDLRQKARDGFARGASLRDLLNELKDAGLARPELYRLLLEEKRGNRQSDDEAD